MTTTRFQFDINKLLVPTSPIYAWDTAGDRIPIPGSDKDLIASGMEPDVPPIRGVLQSWFDAPGAGEFEIMYDADGNVIYDETTGAALINVKSGGRFKEELREYSISIGTEYWYNDIFAVRAGYFYENKYKGARQYVTLGVGLRYNVFGLDFSYLLPTTGVENPLQNTLRFSLIFNFGAADKGEAKAPTG